MKVHEIDVINGAEQDLDDDKVWDEVLIRIRARACSAIIVSPPCATFSRATYNRTKGPPPMRSAKFPWGFPWILGRRRSKLRHLVLDFKNAFFQFPVQLEEQRYFVTRLKGSVYMEPLCPRLPRGAAGMRQSTCLSDAT